MKAKFKIISLYKYFHDENDFAYISDADIDDNGVITIIVTSDCFKYWTVGTLESNNLIILNSVEDQHDKSKTYSFCFEIALEDTDKNSSTDYYCEITPMEYKYEIKLIPNSLFIKY
jgi:hypothetical protein